MCHPMAERCPDVARAVVDRNCNREMVDVGCTLSPCHSTCHTSSSGLACRCHTIQPRDHGMNKTKNLTGSVYVAAHPSDDVFNTQNDAQ